MVIIGVNGGNAIANTPCTSPYKPTSCHIPKQKAQLLQFGDQCRHAVCLLDLQALYAREEKGYTFKTTGGCKCLCQVGFIHKVVKELFCFILYIADDDAISYILRGYTKIGEQV